MSKQAYNEIVEGTFVEPGHDVAPNAWVADGSPTRQRGIMTTDREHRAADKFSVNKNRKEPMTTDREREALRREEAQQRADHNHPKIPLYLSTPIVNRLRGYKGSYGLMNEAADFIESLIHENEALRHGRADAEIKCEKMERENEALRKQCARYAERIDRDHN